MPKNEKVEKVKLQFTGPVPSDTPYGQMNPNDTVEVDKKIAEDEVKRNSRNWNIIGGKK